MQLYNSVKIFVQFVGGCLTKQEISLTWSGLLYIVAVVLESSYVDPSQSFLLYICMILS